MLIEEKIKSISKVKAANHKNRLQKLKTQTKDLIENPPEIRNKTNEEIVHGQLDIKLRHSTEDKLDIYKDN